MRDDKGGPADTEPADETADVENGDVPVASHLYDDAYVEDGSGDHEPPPATKPFIEPIRNHGTEESASLDWRVQLSRAAL